MPPFKVVHSSAADAAVAAESCARQLRPLPEGANLGFVYVTDLLAGRLDGILGRLREETGIDHWVGGIGLGICAGGRGFFDRPAVAIMAATLPDGSFSVVPTIGEGGGPSVRENHGSRYRPSLAVERDPQRAGRRVGQGPLFYSCHGAHDNDAADRIGRRVDRRSTDEPGGNGAGRDSDALRLSPSIPGRTAPVRPAHDPRRRVASSESGGLARCASRTRCCGPEPDRHFSLRRQSNPQVLRFRVDSDRAAGFSERQLLFAGVHLDMVP